MNKILTRLAIPALALLAAAPASAEWGEWFVAPSILFNDGAPERKVDDGFSGVQINLGRDFGSSYSFEGHLGYSVIDGYYLVAPPNQYVRDDENVLDLSANVLLHHDRDAEFDMYAIAGLGYLRYNYNVNDGHESRPSATFGFGFKWKSSRSSRLALRTEARYRLGYEQDYNFDDFVIGIGVQWAFGSGSRGIGPPTDKPRDTDGDGVLDMWDDCPNTRAGVDVTARGCEIQDMTRDSDGDRVPDNRDKCPNTARGAPVNQDGCSLDSDMDGVLTGQDRCPGSRPGAVVDQNGCEISDVINLPGINFGSGSDMLLPGFERLLMDAATMLNRYPDLKVEVAGHTDDVGDASLNLSLSERRAKTVRDYLIRYGVNPSRLTYRGYGESQPIANNSTIEGRAQNRRVELRITSR